ncbi:MAG: efflux RND transporter periplasmic adaptor subunit [Nitrospirae bacterium]|nr:efflux RND transporter periplasmic adaptor subunit [Nitrospirota bacterium]
MRNALLKIMAIASLIAALAGCTEKVKPGVAEVRRQQVTGVTIEVIRPAMVDDYFETSGTVKAKSVSTVSSRLMGSVKSMRVKEGDRVVAGQLLMLIDDSDMVQKVSGAYEGYKEAQKGLEAAREHRNLTDITYQRYKKLADEKALSGQELDQIETQKKIAELDYERAKAAAGRAEAGLNETKVYHNFTRIASPVSGIVTAKNIETGSMAVPGMPLFLVEDNSSYRIEVNCDEKLAGKVRPGMEAKVFIEALNKELKAGVSEVVPSVDTMSRSFLVRIAIKGEGLKDLKNGFYAKVLIPVDRKEVLLVPKKAVVEKGQLAGVYVVGDGSVISYRLVRTGRVYDDRTEILSGLNPDEKVIVEGMQKAVDGGIAVTQK